MPEVSSLTATAPAVSPSPAAAKKDPLARVRDAACQFESLLMGQIMKSMNESAKGWLGDSDDDQAGATATELAQEQFAQALGRGGGLGLARAVVSSFQAHAKDASTG